MMAGHVN